ncbi:MAG: DUF6249 domain-containing protein [Mariniphaga sp.]
MEELSIMFIWLGFFASIFFGWYYYLQARHSERMALIEKNVDVTEIFRVRKTKFSFPWFKIGMMVTGVGLGFFLAMFITYYSRIPAEIAEPILIGFLLFFGGMGIIIAYFIEKPKEI